MDRLIERRHDQRVTVEGERPAEEAWQESERRQEARGREENWASWCEYHEQAERHRAVERRQDTCYDEPKLRRGG